MTAPHRSRVALAALVVLAAGAGARAQEIRDLRWELRDGELWYVDLPFDAFDQHPPEWQPMFGGLLRPRAGETTYLADELWALGPAALLPLLATGDGGAAALVDPERRQRKLGVPLHCDLRRDWWHDGSRSISAGETRVPVPPGDQLDDLQYVGYLATLDLNVADWELHRASGASPDPFVRAAASRELHRRAMLGPDRLFASQAEPVGRSAEATLAAGLARMPSRFDLALGADVTALPDLGALLRARRSVMFREGCSGLMQQATISMHLLVAQQLRADRLEQAAIEVAQRLGNWRVDSILATLQCGDRDRWWIHLGGAFQPARIATGLAREGFAAKPGTSGEVECVVAGWHVRASATTLEFWQEGCDVADRGERSAELRSWIQDAEAPCWARIPVASTLLTRAGLPAADLAFHLHWSGRPRFAEATATAADAAAAASLRDALAAWQRTWALRADQSVPGPDTTWGELVLRPPGVWERERTEYALRSWIDRIRCAGSGAAIEWHLDLGRASAEDLARCSDPRFLALVFGF